MSENLTPISLTSQARSALKGAAHTLRPVVLIGDQGLSSAVVQEIDRALKAHELIKIRAASQEREERSEILTNICEQLGCAAVSHLGKTLIVYRPSEKGLYATLSGLGSPPPVKRKTSEPHTPKKLAALGKKAPKKRAVSRTQKIASTGDSKRSADSDKFGLRAFSSEKSASRPTTAKSKLAGRAKSRTGAATGRRTGTRSALSLRAGARRRSD